jgi:rubrerythrin
MLTQALIATSICVVWLHYFTAASQSQFKVNSKGCYSRVLYNDYYHHSTVSHRLHELSKHVSVTAAETEKNAKWVSEESDSVVWNSCACNVKKVNILLKSANFYQLYDLESSMLLQLRSQKDNRDRWELRKEAFSESHSWKCTRCDKS